jgi:hypothetical protein
MSFDINAYKLCVAGCAAVCIEFPPPLGEALIAACAAGCLLAAESDNISLETPPPPVILDPTWPGDNNGGLPA